MMRYLGKRSDSGHGLLKLKAAKAAKSSEISELQDPFPKDWHVCRQGRLIAGQ
jgi:hypothetical protein